MKIFLVDRAVSKNINMIVFKSLVAISRAISESFPAISVDSRYRFFFPVCNVHYILKVVSCQFGFLTRLN
jgi:hypothetical protein